MIRKIFILCLMLCEDFIDCYNNYYYRDNFDLAFCA